MIEATAQGDLSVARPRLGVLATHPIQYQVPLYQALTRRGHVDLEVAFLSDAGLRSYRDPGFGRDVRWDVDLTSGYRFVVLARDGSGVLSRLALVPRLAGWIRRQSAVVVHGHRHPGMLLAVLLCRLLRRPYLLRGEAQVQGLGTSPGRRVARALVARAVVRGSAAALPIGTGNAAFYRRFGQDRLFSAPYSVDDARFAVAPAQDRASFLCALGLDPALPVVLFCGKLIPVKRPCDVIEAFGMLTAPASLLIVGEGPLRREVEQRLPERGAALAGFLNQAALPAAYHAADVLVLPSSQEPWGLVVNEAMHAGVIPVVSDRVGCAPDLVSGVGEVFPCGDVPALASAIDRALARAATAEARSAAKGRAAAFSLARTAEGYEAAATFVQARRDRDP